MRKTISPLSLQHLQWAIWLWTPLTISYECVSQWKTGANNVNSSAGLTTVRKHLTSVSLIITKEIGWCKTFSEIRPHKNYFIIGLIGFHVLSLMLLRLSLHHLANGSLAFISFFFFCNVWRLEITRETINCLQGGPVGRKVSLREKRQHNY